MGGLVHWLSQRLLEIPVKQAYECASQKRISQLRAEGWSVTLNDLFTHGYRMTGRDLIFQSLEPHCHLADSIVLVKLQKT
jgi:hypothetical protein